MDWFLRSLTAALATESVTSSAVDTHMQEGSMTNVVWCPRICRAALVGVLGSVVPGVVYGAGDITFRNVADDPAMGLAYANGPTPRVQELESFVGVGPMTFPEFLARPDKANGMPGVVIFDYDNDGDDDVYIANGPGVDNSLFENQLVPTGTMWFIDVAAAAGVTATAQESSGVIAGDIDNDGDRDLYVLGNLEPNILFRNNGDGTFTDITAVAGVAGNQPGSASASFGDVNGDGLLDLFVANSFDMVDFHPILLPVPELLSPNELFINLGGNVFQDVSDSSGIREQRGFIDAGGNILPSQAGISWACAMVDYDRDGDIDIIVGDDQAAVPNATAGGVNRGLIHVLENDGSGHFVDVNVERGLAVTGAWMGLSFGDYNADGYLDLFGSNFGDDNISNFLGVPVLDVMPSRWFLNNGDGTFYDPISPAGLPGVISTHFGWGTVSFDYDNDGDTDILYHGDMDDGVEFVLSNPGHLLTNDGFGNFVTNTTAFDPTIDHNTRMVNGLAVGDLDKNGFLDVVSVSAVDVDRVYSIPNPFDFGGAWDGIDATIPSFYRPEPGVFLFNPDSLRVKNGSLVVEMNNGENRNKSAAVRVMGTVGLTSGGRNNRDGVGAIVAFTPVNGQTVLRPVIAGDSYASQNSHDAHFGLGKRGRGTADVWWPGGVRNRLHFVAAGETVLMPEIPCSIDEPIPLGDYVQCVDGALTELVAQGVISSGQRGRLYASAIVGYQEEH
jgi:enediyne biosynthesis protein E4